MILVSILLPFIMQPAAPARKANPVEMQVRATQAHKAYRERARSPQRCEAQTASANGAAAKAALEATQARRQLLTELTGRAHGVSGASQAGLPDGDELGKAIALLTRDMETSAAMMAKADSKPEAGPEQGFLKEAFTLPRPEALGGLAGEPALDASSVISSVVGDLVTEESLLSAYFSSSRLEIERACIEKIEPAADPFRVPARATKRPKGVKK
ncbi:MAG: hypothetical protein C0504_10600 [Candidatus Solibacter sp.]|nr:hypothetical protein [Candidatus Solibacter sp.]